MSVNSLWPVASFTAEVNLGLAKCALKTNGCLANTELTSLVKEATGDIVWHRIADFGQHWFR